MMIRAIYREEHAMRGMTGIVTLAAATVVFAGPPPTEVRPVKETIHGVTLVDNYRWLEGDNSDPANMGRLTDEVAAWTDAQNAYTRDVLDNLPGRAKLESRLRELMEVGSVSTPTMRGNRYFFSRREGDQAQAIVYMREGYNGDDITLLDPNTLDPDGLVTVSWYTPNHHGNLLAFGMFRAGDENSTLYVMDVDTGLWLADEIPGKTGSVNWLPDSSGFFYDNLEDIDDPYSGRVMFHTLGTHYRQDIEVVSQRRLADLYEGYNLSDQRLKELSTTYGPMAYTSRDAKWMVVGYWTGTRDNDLWVVDLDRWFRTGELVKKEIMFGEHAQGFGPIVGDTLYLYTTLDAPNGRVFAVDLNNPARDNWVEVIAEDDHAVLQGVSAARGILVAQYLQNATSRIALFDMKGRSLGDMELPGIGSAGLATEDDRTEAYLSFASYNWPRSIFRVDLATGERELWERPEVPVDPSIVQVDQVWYPSKDGTKVSMFLVHKKGLELNGKNPTILYGYGGFNISMTPYFSATMFPWYEAGGVYAIANLRGGGEYGQAWHEAGRLDKKQNVFDDFIAAGEWLIDNGYTDSDHLGIAGGSNGGLLTGACLVQRPDLFSAVIVAVPLLDMIRYDNFLMAKYWVPEYGSAKDPEQFQWLIKYSPYQNIKPGTAYPAVFLTAGENDTRVHALHARKMAAALQAATTSDPDEKPILLWVEREAGHGGGKPLDMRVRDVADSRIFMMWQLGMLDL